MKTAFSNQVPGTHLYQPRLQLLVQHDVETEDLEAAAALDVVGEAGAVVVLEDRVGGDQGLDDHVVDVGPDLLYVVAVADEPLVHCGDFSIECHRNQEWMIKKIVEMG